ncbi:TetR family transcriptional regulator [Streptomyces sulfonofaciens]|uniref:TetR family transcriptional regulator n=1 Tax=Streptomyces sulfonofaciens TaxID=68272 RepID=A0A919GPK1_9ACTN|nr:TetR/AcrR family transcriptional regulator [Streptomyces sulfonofaciens]GHH87888.1 TetR family transcriptional regulator [Streptomyces sulfonofaciens]
MARWEPNAPQRLADAALELFAERGYENTTVLDIAQRAGLAKSTFFRHFQDKREVLFGENALAGPLVAAIAAAPAEAAPLDAVACGFDALARDVFTPARRAFTVRRRAVIDAHPDLQEREALKGVSLTASMTRAMADRGLPDLVARVTAELGALALRIAYRRWSDSGNTDEFGALARRALGEVQAAALTVEGGPGRFPRP